MTVPAFQGSFNAFQFTSHAFQAPIINEPNQPTIPPGPPWMGEEWWGSQDSPPPIFPLDPTLGFVPPVVVVSNAPPTYALWAYDTGWIGYVRN